MEWRVDGRAYRFQRIDVYEKQLLIRRVERRKKLGSHSKVLSFFYCFFFAVFI